MTAPLRQWEEVLEAEGLGVLDETERLHKFRDMTAAQVDALVTAVETWQAWANGVLDSFPFANDHQRLVWSLYAEGCPTRDIPYRLRTGDFAVGSQRARNRLGQFVWAPCSVALRSIERFIADVKSHYPDRPRNPWRQKETTP